MLMDMYYHVCVVNGIRKNQSRAKWNVEPMVVTLKSAKAVTEYRVVLEYQA